jgi:hypothetical protein
MCKIFCFCAFGAVLQITTCHDLLSISTALNLELIEVQLEEPLVSACLGEGQRRASGANSNLGIAQP